MPKKLSSAGTDRDDSSARSTQSDDYIIELVADNSSKPRTLASYIGVYIWLGWFHMYLTLIVSLPFLYYFRLTHTYAFAAFIGLLVLSAVMPIERSVQPSWGYKIGEWMLHQAAVYFQLKVYCEDYKAVLDAKQAVLAMEPHDILPVSIFAYSKYLNYFPSHDMLGCLTSICFLIPGMRHIYTWGGAISVDKKQMQRYLKLGHSTGLCPGGVQEVTYMKTPDTKECVLFLRSRLGLIKLAAERGIPVVPSFTFNQRPCYSWIIPDNALTRWIGRKIGFLPLVYFGLYGSVFGPPKPTALTVVVGKPINVPLLQPDATTGKFTEAAMQPYLDQLIAAYERIYENNKERFGMGDVVLKIV